MSTNHSLLVFKHFLSFSDQDWLTCGNLRGTKPVTSTNARRSSSIQFTIASAIEQAQKAGAIVLSLSSSDVVGVKDYYVSSIYGGGSAELGHFCIFLSYFSCSCAVGKANTTINQRF